jgi:SWI/SNF-related matrix-associated actin-dependent regulator 1 of chromatin subfamily A
MRTKLFNDFAIHSPRLWLLTGTPITNRPINFYNLLKLCNHRVARSWVGFVIRYCAGKQFYGRGGRRIWDTKGSSNLDELKENTQDIMLRVRKEDVLDLPEKIIQPIYLPMKNKNEYQRIVGEYNTWAEHQKSFNLAMHLAQLVQLRQFLALSKIESTIEIAENAIEEGKKVVIFTNFTEPLLQLQSHFGNRCVIHHGPLSKSNREESVERFQDDPEVKVFIGNIISAGVGITLTAGELVIFNDLSWLPSDHLQAQDRAFRIGQTKTVNVYYNIIDESLDLYLFESLMKKMKVIDQVMGDSNVDEDIFESVIKKINS